MLENCTLCPHKCGINRIEGHQGRCKCDDKLKIALASLHMFEEPCISGENGSGTVFFLIVILIVYIAKIMKLVV